MRLYEERCQELKENENEWCMCMVMAITKNPEK